MRTCFFWSIVLLVSAMVFIGCGDSHSSSGGGGSTFAITSTSGTCYDGEPYSHQLTVTGNVGTVTWSTVSGAFPTGLTLSASGRIEGTPTATVGDIYQITIRATDGSTGATTDALFTLEVSKHLSASTTLTAAPVNQSYSFDLQTKVSGGDAPYTFTLEPGEALPTGLNLTADGLLSGTPTITGNFSFTIRIKDTMVNGFQAELVATFYLSVT